ncbi:NAD(P)H-dependent flavin oxidoreductase [Nesterenkonia sp. K-15-9-6]|uniref:NAD(P)H-dependent flavin oxidoreductase n=1 Tax=Nesterenkonia sp. K-15-9-6 TaxID=3093918 RepID=UPI00404475E3
MSTRLEQLLGQLRTPILQAPMAGGPTTPALVAAVHRAGAFGQVAGGNLTAAALAAQLDATGELLGSSAPPDGSLPIGVNLFVPDPDTADAVALEAYRAALHPVAVTLGTQVPEVPAWSDDDFPAKVELLVTRPVAAVSFTFGLPSAEVVRHLQQAGSAVVITVADLPGALRAAALEPDGLVVQGQQAGGHRSVLDMHDEPERIDTADLLRTVRRALADGGSAGLPLIGAGGVGTAQDVAALCDAGARAVQVGTQFLTAAEAGTRAPHREAVLDPARRETVVTRAFSGRPARGLRNRFIEDMDGQAVPGYPQVNQLTAPLRAAAAAAGDAEHLSLWAGTRTDACREESAADVVARLTP